MSPVSKGRKPKKSKKRKDARGRSGGHPPRKNVSPSDDSLAHAITEARARHLADGRPRWWRPALQAVIDGADGLSDAESPRELEQAVAELMGAQLYAASQDGMHLEFDVWFDDLLDATLDRVRADPTWEHGLRLLHALFSIAPPEHQDAAEEALLQAASMIRRAGLHRDKPSWLRSLPQVSMNGQVFRLVDEYGTRFGVIAEFTYRGTSEPVAYLFDVDSSAFVPLVHAGVYDNVDAAAAAWQSEVGLAAVSAQPAPVDKAEQLACLMHCDILRSFFSGNETPPVMDNFFRARRRIADLAAVLEERGMPLPPATSLYRNIDNQAMTSEFTSWHESQHGTSPDPDVVDALAYEWMEGALPETWYCVSPRRIDMLQSLVGDWIADAPVTIGVKAIFPDWVHWLASRQNLRPALQDQLFAVLTS